MTKITEMGALVQNAMLGAKDVRRRDNNRV
jgi:hypothetical protein